MPARKLKRTTIPSLRSVVIQVVNVRGTVVLVASLLLHHGLLRLEHLQRHFHVLPPLLRRINLGRAQGAKTNGGCVVGADSGAIAATQVAYRSSEMVGAQQTLWVLIQLIAGCVVACDPM